MSNVVETVNYGIQNAIFLAKDDIITPRLELVVKSKKALSGQNVASVTANSEYGEEIGVSASPGNVSDRNSTFGE